jgi:pyruvate/2-oxoglutarate/acetoin dehydrogenase E1 component
MYLNKDCDALRDEMYHRAESQMHELVKTLSESAEALHNEMMQSLFNALNAQADRLKASDDTLTYVEQYEKETLPTLKEQLIG